MMHSPADLHRLLTILTILTILALLTYLLTILTIRDIPHDAFSYGFTPAAYHTYLTYILTNHTVLIILYEIYCVMPSTTDSPQLLTILTILTYHNFHMGYTT